MLMKTIQASAAGTNAGGHVLTSSAIGGALAIVAVYAMGQFHLQTTPELTAALGIIFTVIGGWATRSMVSAP